MYRKKIRGQLAEGSPELAHAMTLMRRLRAEGMTYLEARVKTKIARSTLCCWFQGMSKPNVQGYEKLKTYFGESL
jgi:hypothetical protein